MTMTTMEDGHFAHSEAGPSNGGASSFLDLLTKEEGNFLSEKLQYIEPPAFETPQFELPEYDDPLEPLLDDTRELSSAAVLGMDYVDGREDGEDEDEDEDEGESDERDYMDGEDEFERWMQAAQATGGDVSTMAPLPNWDMTSFADDMAEFDDTLRESRGIGKRRRGRPPKCKNLSDGPPTIREPKLPPDITAMLSEANMNYVNREYAEAIEKYQDVIRRNPNVHIAWVNLGMIQEELGNKEKAVQLALVAAHLRPKDGEAWRRLGRMSTDLGAIRQAIYCYSKAIQADPSDVDAIWDRSFLYKQIGRFIHATAGFTKLLELAPHNIAVISELAKVYREVGFLDKAIKCYEDAMAYYTSMPHTDTENVFGYTELNILSELYMMANNYERALEIIKLGVRRLQGREQETGWDEIEESGEGEDREYLEDELGGESGTSRLEMPMELRVRMGIARVMLGQVNEAKAHFKFLYSQPVAAYPDLYQEVAETFMDKRLYSNALTVFEHINNSEDGVAPEILIQLGDCHRQLGNLDQAAEYYTFVVEENPTNRDVKMALAQVYEELGEEEKAFELVTEVVREAKEEKRKKRESAMTILASGHVQLGDQLTDHRPAASFFDESIADINPSKRSERYDRMRAQHRATVAESRAREEAEREKETLAKFEQIRIMERRMEATMGERAAQDRKRATWEYTRLAEEVFNEFRSTKEFYPSDRMKIFTGFRRYGGRRKDGRSSEQAAEEKEQEEQVRRMATRLRDRLKGPDDGLDDNQTEEDRESEEEYGIRAEEPQKTATCFRGVGFDAWFSVIVKYAMLLATSNREADAYGILKQAGNANVFYHDPKRRIAMKLVLMTCAIANHDYEMVCEVARWLCSYRALRNDVYRIYGVGLSSGIAALTQFASSNSLKYFLRQIKAMDVAVQESNKDATRPDFYLLPGDIGLDEDPIQPKLSTRETRGINSGTYKPKKPSHALLMLYAHSLNCARSYVGAIGYYFRAYAVSPLDPLISLCLGLSYLHRAMQRHTDNRHLQIVQGFTFLLKYHKLRGESQEAEFNLARAFHHLGLTHLAVPYYQRVLDMPSLKESLRAKGELEVSDDGDDETNLKCEAAYNLSLIYVSSGSPGLSQIILAKYCTI